MREFPQFVAEHDPKVARAMLDKLAVSENPASEAQKGNQNAVKEKNDSADLPVGLSPQLERAKSNGLSERNQRTLDKIAKVAPEYLPRIAAKEITINRAAVELGIVKVRTPLEQALSAFQRLSDDDKEKFMELAESLMEAA